ncbi:YihY/virulence factor BrkB family protein [Luteolibacter sp. AS25]|uniref:YihY/virulence factor BrkB family protein n=1 Tax=Luteolibacter sp. AS25 TaxID=3135776 RepID=UPI00398A9758
MISLLKETFKEFMEDKAMRLSAALAYYSVFSLAPLLIIAISIAGSIFGEKAAEGAIQEQLTQTIGKEAAVAVESMISSAHLGGDSWIMTLVGIGALLVTASGVFAQLKDAMNTVWGLKPKPGLGITGFLKGRLAALSMVLVIGFLLLVSLVADTASAVAIKWLGDALPIPGFLFQGITFTVSIGIVTLLFAMIFRILPDAEIRWSDVWKGAFLTAILFAIGKMLLGIYLGREGASSTYGAAGALILLLSWVYYSANILLLGAEFTQVYARHRGRRIEPNESAIRES